MSELILTFYGDDFTGSTDSLEALTLGGLRCALFLQPPTPAQLRGRFADLEAFGVAGVSRSMTPAQMDAELIPKFRALQAFNAPLFHYKVCSTFDSSPAVGSIGHAIDIGQEIFRSPYVPLVVGALVLNRYVAFGNLFATVGGPEGDTTYRIDRHPTMSRHPITPMSESDLRLHLGQQTDKRIALLDLLALDQAPEILAAHFDKLLADRPDIILFDTLNDEHLVKIGRLIWQSRGDATLFIGGSSGVEYALIAYLRSEGRLPPPQPVQAAGAVEQMVVISGSAAPTTASQIAWAELHGFAAIRLEGRQLIDPDQAEYAVDAAVRQALETLASGASPMLFAARGPDDPAIDETRAAARQLGIGGQEIGQRIAQRQGQILRAVLEQSGVRRVCVAGGDTSGYAARQLGIYALEVITPISPGAPLCRASSEEPLFDGLEISLKGGQNGMADYFGSIQKGEKVTS